MNQSICFSGSGWAFIYYLGIAKYMQEKFNLENVKYYGVSGGCIPIIFLALDYKIDSLFDKIKNFALFCNNGYINTSLYLYKFMNEICDLLPQDICSRIQGKVIFSATRLPWFMNELLEKFDDKNELFDALICSCYSPLFFPSTIGSYRNNYYLDGMISNDQPKLDEDTIVISAFFNREIKKKKNYLTSFYYPGNIEEIEEMFRQGYIDAENNLDLFVNKNFKLKEMIKS